MHANQQLFRFAFFKLCLPYTNEFLNMRICDRKASIQHWNEYETLLMNILVKHKFRPPTLGACAAYFQNYSRLVEVFNSADVIKKLHEQSWLVLHFNVKQGL